MPETPNILTVFKSIADPRREHQRFHPLSSVLFLSLTGVLCGADSFRSIEIFGKEKLDILQSACEFPHGIPSHDTIGRVLALLNKEAFHQAFIQWVQQWKLNLKGKHIAIDGKTLKGSADSNSESNALHVISAFASDYGMVFGQLATQSKSNEITAIPKLLKQLCIKGSIITIDAMGCQKEIASVIRSKQADYLLALKGNQGTLHRDVIEFYQAHRESDPSFTNEPGFFCDVFETHEKSRGRKESRRVIVTNDLCPGFQAHKQSWKDLNSIVMVERKVEKKDKITEEIAYYISSAQPDAQAHYNAIRSHWAIENTLHWTLDVVFDEDRSRARATKNAAENLNTLRHMTLNLIKRNKETTISIKAARLKAGWNCNYMIQLITGK